MEQEHKEISQESLETVSGGQIFVKQLDGIQQIMAVQNGKFVAIDSQKHGNYRGAMKEAGDIEDNTEVPTEVQDFMLKNNWIVF